MDSDLALVTGILVFALSIAVFIGAFSGDRSAASALVFFVLGGMLIAYAMHASHQTLTVTDVPNAFARVFSRYL